MKARSVSSTWQIGKARPRDLPAKTEILTGLHASALAVSPDRRHVVVANAGSDTLSVIDTRSDQVVETIWTRQSPADLFGAGPNALAFDRSGQDALRLQRHAERRRRRRLQAGPVLR